MKGSVFTFGEGLTNNLGDVYEQPIPGLLPVLFKSKQVAVAELSEKEDLYRFLLRHDLADRVNAGDLQFRFTVTAGKELTGRLAAIELFES